MEKKEELEITPAKARFSRRSLLKSAAALASAALVPSSLARLASTVQTPAAAKPESSRANAAAENPRWYGFNLLEYFSTDADWMKYFPYKNDGMFLEDDFRWIRDWGFNWVRLPMDYRFWTSPDLFTINEKKVEPIDRAIRLGEKFEIHVNLCLHRAPGLCILDTMDEKLTGINVTKEKTDVFTDSHTFDAFIHQWTYFADRYKGISSKHLSFNLVNEPVVLPNAAELAEMRQHGPIKPADLFSPERMRRHEKDYVRLAKAS
ncbi:MAG TPA: cellulase family glycosylhydrolase, partial [Terriglobales bacterium]|nr:cellulase family glycosylhydrolase [Terriglobales bacterium]